MNMPFADQDMYRTRMKQCNTKEQLHALYKEIVRLPDSMEKTDFLKSIDFILSTVPD